MKYVQIEYICALDGAGGVHQDSAFAQLATDVAQNGVLAGDADANNDVLESAADADVARRLDAEIEWGTVGSPVFAEMAPATVDLATRRCPKSAVVGNDVTWHRLTPCFASQSFDRRQISLQAKRGFSLAQAADVMPAEEEVMGQMAGGKVAVSSEGKQPLDDADEDSVLMTAEVTVASVALEKLCLTSVLREIRREMAAEEEAVTE